MSDNASSNKQEYPKASDSMVYGGLLAYFAGLLLLIAFASPYWLESFDETFSSFKNMGLWEYCFDQFRFPNYQFDHLFDGCNWIFSQELYLIREWLVPGWLMVVQTCVTLALIISLFAQIMIAAIVCRYPLRLVLEYEWLLSGICFICQVASGFFLFLAVCIFGGEAYRRDWMMYPQYNFISWSYGLCVCSMFFHLFSAAAIYFDTRNLYENREQSNSLVMQMYPTQRAHIGHMGVPLYPSQSSHGGYL
ncbi:uncharacterized protein LOC132204496 [Neocloeon triangulifer]|uniref:uncharacterized protein LOC132198732 n=1 Tax=Neocloeon triangulifer TaxID=2078957 RepID=UPI00286EEDD1|nr:uncharacterized protein LOC132198732 [Neocloeon triangulifer]XP_059489015.1 uncharacterized protein LOC132204496 [Neocloeon triangulifer]